MPRRDLDPLLDDLLSRGRESECVEFKEAKNTYDFSKLGRYFSALSNEANLSHTPAAWLVFGVDQQCRIVGTRYREQTAQLNSLKKEIADKTTQRLTFIDIHEVQRPEGRVLLFEIPPAPPGIPTAWEGHYYGREDESLAALSLSELERIRNQTRPDWSAQTIEGATLADLSPDAIIKARQNYKVKHPNLAAEVDDWSDREFLDKAKVTLGGKITHTAILLLGRDESSRWLSPAVAQMTWVLRDGKQNHKDYAHFGPPFLLNVDALFARVRNLTYRYLRDNTLFPTEVTQYDPWVMRELLHNCIAHQDYSLGHRISVVEWDDDSLLFTNSGDFIPRSVERVIEMNSPPAEYRNPFLAQAMVELGMIDTIGSGIRRVFAKQRERFFPLPEYDLSDPQQVQVRLFGRMLDENYTRALMQNTDLDLLDVFALDKVQKQQPLSDQEFKRLKRRHLIEGRRPHLRVAAHIAQATGDEAAYIRNRPLDNDYYKKLITEYLDKFGQAEPADIKKLLTDKLPDMLGEYEKNRRISNLLQQMANQDRTIVNIGGRGKSAKWRLAKPPRDDE